ncbi:hypothetical protein PSAL_002540 [Pseudooceanicola algae]|uniref:Uncharacterized protein n=1 Tax=Pseudooceanicola algae TaxID=1537215 RepID=A0A418SEY9_9RHOB|nr:hypothetical protein PSAL_002540 [Pseudooceanicola algae]
MTLLEKILTTLGLAPQVQPIPLRVPGAPAFWEKRQ